MATAGIERTAQQSLLDRLVDEEPRVPADPPPSWAKSVRAFKAGVRRDLEWLLNTRRIPEPPPDSAEELRRSLYCYGLPDVTSLSWDSIDDRMRLMRHVEEVITLLEPRLSGVRVSLAEGDADDRRHVRFLVEATLRMDPAPERVVFDTVLEVSTGDYRVTGE